MYFGRDLRYREEAIEKTSKTELIELTNSISKKDAKELDNWFCNPDILVNPTNEYIKFSVFLMAYEYVKSVLKK